jgi:hypothetical protein
VTGGVTSSAGVQRTIIPEVPKEDVTDNGAFGSEYVAACAEGTKNDRSSEPTRAREPRPRDLFFVKFMP